MYVFRQKRVEYVYDICRLYVGLHFKKIQQI